MSHGSSTPNAPGVFPEPRLEATPETLLPTGTVLFSFDDPLPTEVPALLISREPRAFHLRHHCATLHAGQIVDFEDLLTKGRAQVLSTEQKAGWIETRFWVIAETP